MAINRFRTKAQRLVFTDFTSDENRLGYRRTRKRFTDRGVIQIKPSGDFVFVWVNDYPCACWRKGDKKTALTIINVISQTLVALKV